MANSARARSTCAAGALSERLRRVNSLRSSAVSGRRGSVWWRDMGHLGARGSPHHYTSSHGRRPTSCARAAARIRRAVAAHPFMVAGTGRFETVLMERLGERAFVKAGAEGVHCAALPELGYGIAVKCDDGTKRAAEVVLASVILRFLRLDDEERAF